MADDDRDRTVAEVLAGNVRAYRLLRNLDQRQLGSRMTNLGQSWRQATVSDVERVRRNVTVPELVALTLCLGASVEQLLDPRGPERRTGPRLLIKDREIEYAGDEEAGDLVRSVAPLAPSAERPTVDPRDVSGLVCSHKVYVEVQWGHDGGPLKFIDFHEGRPDLTDLGPDWRGDPGA